MTIERLGLGSVLTDYQRAWDRQRELHAARVAGAIDDHVLLLEHASVYTAGRRTQPEERPQDGTPVVDVDRGGKITWHGPGQLVGYPIVGLDRLPATPGAPGTHAFDLVGYVRRMESMLMDVCRDLGLATMQVAGRSGVWVAADDHRPERKVAAIGVRVVRGVALHGFALNCDPDLTAFDRIIPCGLRDAGVTSLTAETGQHVAVATAADVVEAHIGTLLARPVEIRHVPSNA